MSGGTAASEEPGAEAGPEHMNPFLVWCRLLNWLWALAGVGCLAASAAFVGGRGSEKARGGLSERWERNPRLRAAVFVLLPAALAAHKWLQYRACEMTADDADVINMLWRVAHGFGMSSYSYSGASYLSNHFSLLLLPLSPFFLSRWGTPALILAQSLALGSAPAAAYLWVKEETGDSGRAALTALATAACPMFASLASSILIETTFALPLFLWALYFVSRRRPVPAFLLLLGLVFTREEVPLLLFGFGLAEGVSSGGAARKWRGLALAALSAVLWWAEMRCVGYFRALRPGGLDFWRLFDFVKGSGAAGLGQALILRPGVVLGALFLPPHKLLVVARVMGTLGLIPLAAGSALLPALAVWLPHQLAHAGHSFQSLRNHHGAIVLAALVYAFHGGFGRLQKAFPRRRDSLAAVALLGASFGFLTAPALRVVRAPASWFYASEGAVAAVPDGAKVWSDDYLLARLAQRRFLSPLPLSARDAADFVPDRVVASAYWTELHPLAAERLAASLRRGRYAPVFTASGLWVFARPGPEERPSSGR